MVIHGIWLDDGDLDRIATRGAMVAHHQVSNLKPGSSVMRFSEIAERGISTCLGTDEASADGGGSLWINAKIGAFPGIIGDSEYHT